MLLQAGALRATPPLSLPWPGGTAATPQSERQLNRAIPFCGRQGRSLGRCQSCYWLQGWCGRKRHVSAGVLRSGTSGWGSWRARSARWEHSSLHAKARCRTFRCLGEWSHAVKGRCIVLGCTLAWLSESDGKLSNADHPGVGTCLGDEWKACTELLRQQVHVVEAAWRPNTATAQVPFESQHFAGHAIDEERKSLGVH